MNWWVWPHKNIILTLSVHFFERNLPPSIIIIPDDHVLGGGKKHGTPRTRDPQKTGYMIKEIKTIFNLLKLSIFF